MTNAEYATLKGLTLEQLKRENLAYLQCEGYDEDGNEYETLDAWLDRRRLFGPRDPFDGGRGAGQYGRED
jgi:hypothetical protein